MVSVKVKVRLIGGFIQKLGFSEKELELPEEATADGLLARLGLEGIPALVSREGAGLHGHDRLKDGDRVLVSGMFSGG
jgi:sulfur carrier protein ThiS